MGRTDFPRVDGLEACRVTFDPGRINYGRLVEYFFEIHSRAVTDRQHPYIGSPSRLAVVVRGADQEGTAKAILEKWRVSGKFGKPIVAEVVAEGEFRRAEEFHQRYLEKHGLASCGIQP